LGDEEDGDGGEGNKNQNASRQSGPREEHVTEALRRAGAGR